MTVPEGFRPRTAGGFVRETWRAPLVVDTQRGRRPAVTATQLWLENGQQSDWYRLHGGEELWLWHGGGRLRLRLGGGGRRPATPRREVVLGPGDSHLVPSAEWRSAEPVDAPVRVTCVASPGVDDGDIEVGAPPRPSPSRRASPDTRPGRVLLLCQGNICRSPMAELLLRTELAARGAGQAVTVESAGLGAPIGRPIEPYAATALARLGIEGAARHRARGYTADLAGADLVLAATTALRDEAIRRTPQVRDRAFTWRELIAYDADLPTAPVDGDTAAGRLATWVTQLGSRRGLVHAEDGFDVADPMGRSQKVFVQLADEIAAGMRALADALQRVVA